LEDKIALADIQYYSQNAVVNTIKAQEDDATKSIAANIAVQATKQTILDGYNTNMTNLLNKIKDIQKQVDTNTGKINLLFNAKTKASKDEYCTDQKNAQADLEKIKKLIADDNATITDLKNKLLGLQNTMNCSDTCINANNSALNGLNSKYDIENQALINAVNKVKSTYTNVTPTMADCYKVLSGTKTLAGFLTDIKSCLHTYLNQIPSDPSLGQKVAKRRRRRLLRRRRRFI